MAITLCATCGTAPRLVATSHWDALGFEQLLFGEWPVGGGIRARLLPDVNTTLDDWPCLEDVLEGGSFHATSDWLQLLNGLTEDLQERATGCLIHKAVRGNDKPSDHAPVVVQLQWPAEAEDEDDNDDNAEGLE